MSLLCRRITQTAEMMPLWSYPWMRHHSGPTSSECSHMKGVSLFVCRLQRAVYQQPAMNQRAMYQQPAVNQRAVYQQPAVNQQQVYQPAVYREPVIYQKQKRSNIPQPLHNIDEFQLKPVRLIPNHDILTQSHPPRSSTASCLKICSTSTADSFVSCLHAKCISLQQGNRDTRAKLDNVEEEESEKRSFVPRKRGCVRSSGKRCRNGNNKRKRRWGDSITTCINSHCSALDDAQRFECIVNKCNKERRRSG